MNRIGTTDFVFVVMPDEPGEVDVFESMDDAQRFADVHGGTVEEQPLFRAHDKDTEAYIGEAEANRGFDLGVSLFHKRPHRGYRHYDPPEDVAGTVFDPSSETFGPIMAALQSGDFEKAARLTADLATPPATRYTEDEKAASGVTDEDLKR